MNDAENRVLWGARAIGLEVEINERQAVKLLEKGLLPGKKIGKLWTSNSQALREHLTPTVKPTEQSAA